MLQLTIDGDELFDERTNKFIRVNSQTIQLEHSLVSISKWESKWKKPFLNNKDMTSEQFLDYVRCMTITQNVNPDIYNRLSQENVEQIQEYIDDPMTATWFSNKNKGQNRKIITNEVVYYWMVALQIPFDPCQKWHFNRLMTLIRVCDEMNSPKKKPKKNESLMSRRSLNAARRAQLHTNG